MKCIRALFAVLCLTVSAWGAGSYYPLLIQTPTGNAVAGATVALCTALPTSATPCGGASLEPTYTDITLSTACTLNPIILGPSSGAGCTNPGFSNGVGVAGLFINSAAGTPPGFFYYQVYGQGILTPDIEPIRSFPAAQAAGGAEPSPASTRLLAVGWPAEGFPAR